MFRKNTSVTVSLVIGLILAVYACQPANNTNTNGNANANANMQPANTNANVSSTESTPTINAREPDKYSATLVLSIETSGGDKAVGIPPLSVKVARNSDDRRVDFKLPDGTPLVYLDHQNHHYVIAPSRKQYAELTPDATGIQIRKMLTPGQIVEDLKNVKGYERVGDEQFNGRPAEKYQFSKTTNTNTKAGEIQANAFVYVDKETGLPLRAEASAESSGDVKGVKAARVVIEMRDINTNIDASLFELPAGYSQVAPEKIRQQIDALTSAVAAMLRAMMTSGGGEGAASPSPAASGSPK
jgi:hypothetical protein